MFSTVIFSCYFVSAMNLRPPSSPYFQSTDTYFSLHFCGELEYVCTSTHIRRQSESWLKKRVVERPLFARSIRLYQSCLAWLLWLVYCCAAALQKENFWANITAWLSAGLEFPSISCLLFTCVIFSTHKLCAFKETLLYAKINRQP